MAPVGRDGTVTRTVSRWRRHPVLLGAAGLLALLATVVAARAVGVQQGVERSRAYWSEPQGEAGGLLYVALGDSAAQGVGASSPDKGYVGLIADRLRTSTGRPVQVVNLSVSGARVADVVATQLPQLADLEPDLVTVAIGGNDIREYDQDGFTADVDQLVANLPPGTYVADVPYFMHGRTAAGRPTPRRRRARSVPRPPRRDWSSCPSTTGCAPRGCGACSRRPPPTSSTPTTPGTRSGRTRSGRRSPARRDDGSRSWA